MTKLHIVGWKQCPYHQRAIKYANNNIKNILQIDQRTYNTRDEYREWLLKSDDHKSIIRKLKDDSIAAKHVTSPFVFLTNEDYSLTFVGGATELMKYDFSTVTSKGKMAFHQRLRDVPEDETNYKHQDFGLFQIIKMGIYNITNYFRMQTRFKEINDGRERNNESVFVGAKAPNLPLLSLDGKIEKNILDFASQDKYLVLNFGSCS